MIKTFLFSIFSLFVFNSVDATTSWWDQDTVCRINPSTCYTNMGTGYEPAFWDNTSKCWGQKYVCVDALSETYKNTHHPTDERIAMIRTDIKSPNVDVDFDTTVLNGDCFGVRKTQSGGAKASVNGRFVKVWCNGILGELGIKNEELENGEIISGTITDEPKCTDLATHGYVATENASGKCYGRYYDETQYRIQCDGNNATLIVLNGADGTSGSGDITTITQANMLFAEMLQNARAQHKTYFGE